MEFVTNRKTFWLGWMGFIGRSPVALTKKGRKQWFGDFISKYCRAWLVVRLSCVVEELGGGNGESVIQAPGKDSSW